MRKSLATEVVARLNHFVVGRSAPHNHTICPIAITHAAHHTWYPPSSFIIISR
jgi:hypothetical protein